jgi:hypothetical protein
MKENGLLAGPGLPVHPEVREEGENRRVAGSGAAGFA